MMRAAVFAILAIFTMQVVDIPPSVLHSKTNSKTCCNRTICLCTHAKGALCPIKHAKTKNIQETQLPVPLKLTQAPCHRTAPKTTVPVYFRDFEMIANVIPLTPSQPELLPLAHFSMPHQASSRGIERPPRFLFSF